MQKHHLQCVGNRSAPGVHTTTSVELLYIKPAFNAVFGASVPSQHSPKLLGSSHYHTQTKATTGLLFPSCPSEHRRLSLVAARGLPSNGVGEKKKKSICVDFIFLLISSIAHVTFLIYDNKLEEIQQLLFISDKKTM